eukprot:TRINITY_DN257_c0_g6_i1.p1 TRINITY_DN257_c0_g6~~TRINITY_DN257_c0_g6_i1.p1  ORF type:complete len:620 (+),score=131.42 TRINITY_DN257_c0_g6_i1:192-2051(+)
MGTESDSLLYSSADNGNSVWSRITRKAQVVIPKDDGTGLKRVLSPIDLIAYGLASTVGAGIYVTIGVVASSADGGIGAGPSSAISFIIAGLVSLLSAFCYSEFAARIPVSGSAYTFAYVSLGEFVGWIIGWNLTLEYAISASAVARSWATYLVQFLENSFLKVPGKYLPDWLYDQKVNCTCGADICTKFDLNSVCDVFDIGVLSVVIIVLCTFVIIFGVKESATFNAVVTTINVSCILFIIGLGSFYVDTSNWKPFAPEGITAIMTGSGTLFFSYIGFDSVSTLAGEVKNPQRDLPIGIVGTLLISTTLYVAVTLVITGMVPYANISTTSPLSSAFQSVGISWAGSLVALMAVSTVSATVLASLIGQPRVFYQMAEDGLLYKPFGWLSKGKVPVFSCIVTCILASFLGLIFDLDVLTDMISIGTLMAFTVVCAGVVILRYRPKPGMPTPDKRVVPNSWIPGMMVGFTLYAGIPTSMFHYGWGAINIGSLHISEYVLQVTAFVPLVAIMIILQLETVTDLPATFKCPLVPWIPGLGIVLNVMLIVSLKDAVAACARVGVWSVIGVIIYVTYGYHNSKLNFRNDVVDAEPQYASPMINGADRRDESVQQRHISTAPYSDLD